MHDEIRLTGVEKNFDQDQVIVTKTDLKGLITYANRTFLDVSEYSEDEVIHKPHNMIRHPDMPRCLFRKMWQRLQSGREMFAFVVNRTKLGNHYWVLAHVTPSFDTEQRITGFHSNRRVPERRALEEVIIPLYRELREQESRAPAQEAGIAAGMDHLNRMLREKGVGYDEFIFSL